MLNPVLNQAVHSFAYPITQNPAAIDLPQNVDASKPWLGVGYLTIPAGGSVHQPVSIRLEHRYQLRSLRLRCWDSLGRFDVPGSNGEWLDYITVQLYVNGTAKLTDALPGSHYGTRAPGMGQLRLTRYLPERSYISVDIVSTANVPLYLGGHFIGMAFNTSTLEGMKK